MKCRKFDRLEREMNPVSNFACYRTMFKMANESTGGRVGGSCCYVAGAFPVTARSFIR